jgi:hypothetical protein
VSLLERSIDSSTSNGRKTSDFNTVFFLGRHSSESNRHPFLCFCQEYPFLPYLRQKAWTNQCPVRGRTKLVWMIKPERSFTPNASGEPAVIRQLRIKTIQSPRLTGTSVFSTFFFVVKVWRTPTSRPCLMFENRGPCTVLRFKAKQVRFGMYCRAHLLRLLG